MSTTHTNPISVQTLVAIVLAAHRSGDRELERQAQQELREAHGLRLTFDRKVREQSVPSREVSQ